MGAGRESQPPTRLSLGAEPHRKGNLRASNGTTNHENMGHGTVKRILQPDSGGARKKSPQFRPACGRATMTGNRARIRKLFERQLQPLDVDCLMAIVKFGTVRTADCPKVASALLRRGWVERDGNFVTLSQETKRLLAEAVE